MRLATTCLLLLSARAGGFGRLGQMMRDIKDRKAALLGGPSSRDRAAADGPPADVKQAFLTCHAALGHTLTRGNESWSACVVQELLARQEAAKRERSTSYYRIVPHRPPERPFGPSPEHNQPGAAASSDDLRNWMRDFSCDADAVGSVPARSFSWSHTPADPCAHADLSAAGTSFAHRRDVYLSGCCNDLAELGRDGPMTAAAAEGVCEAHPECQGFTFQASEEQARSGALQILFKARGDLSGAGAGWHAFTRRSAATRAQLAECKSRAEAAAAAASGEARAAAGPPPRSFEVGVLRETPPVYLVREFLTEAECEAMRSRTLPAMGPSVVVGGGVSSWRRSYSVNMEPDYDDEADVVTGLARRQFAFAREVSGYSDVEENAGQEPVNAVYYKEPGDHYGAHCDGECTGGRYQKGHRVATSLVYCTVADEGGATLFTRSGLKVRRARINTPHTRARACARVHSPRARGRTNRWCPDRATCCSSATSATRLRSRWTTGTRSTPAAR